MLNQQRWVERRADFRVRAEHLEEAIEAIETFVAAIAANEPSTTLYTSYQELDDRNRFFHVMRFTNDAAREFHIGTDHVREFVERLYPLCEEEPVFMDIRTIAAR